MVFQIFKKEINKNSKQKYFQFILYLDIGVVTVQTFAVLWKRVYFY